MFKQWIHYTTLGRENQEEKSEKTKENPTQRGVGSGWVLRAIFGTAALLWIVTTPPVRAAPCHPPLHRGGRKSPPCVKGGSGGVTATGGIVGLALLPCADFGTATSFNPVTTPPVRATPSPPPLTQGRHERLCEFQARDLTQGRLEYPLPLRPCTGEAEKAPLCKGGTDDGETPSAGGIGGWDLLPRADFGTATSFNSVTTPPVRAAPSPPPLTQGRHERLCEFQVRDLTQGRLEYSLPFATYTGET